MAGNQNWKLGIGRKTFHPPNPISGLVASLPLRRCGMDLAWISVMTSKLHSCKACTKAGSSMVSRTMDWNVTSILETSQAFHYNILSEFFCLLQRLADLQTIKAALTEKARMVDWLPWPLQLSWSNQLQSEPCYSNTPCHHLMPLPSRFYFCLSPVISLRWCPAFSLLVPKLIEDDTWVIASCCQAAACPVPLVQGDLPPCQERVQTCATWTVKIMI